MQPAGTEESRVLIYITALTCGLCLALAVHIGLTAIGFGLSGPALEVFFFGKDQIKTAIAWWAIGISGCLGGVAAIMVARRWDQPRWQWLRITLAVGFVCLLAAAGHKAAAPPGSGTAVTTAMNLAAMTLGGFMAFFAAHFAARR